MKTLLINGSPKLKNSASGILLETLALMIDGRSEVEYAHFKKHDSAADFKTYEEADTVVIAYPLYVDGVPGHLLACLKDIEKKAEKKKGLRVYGIANCGFYEGVQAAISLDILKNWCNRCGFIWSGGIGIGGGGAITSMPKLKKAIKPSQGISKTARALAGMAEDICSGGSRANVYPSVMLPRWIYQSAAHINWKKKIKANGGKVQDLEQKW